MPILTINVDFGYRRVAMVQDLDPAQDTTIFDFLNGGVIYEQDVAHVLMRALQEGDTALDVGANVGFFTVLMATLVGPGGRLAAFEPGADNLWRLRRNLAASNRTNVTIVDVPASDVAGPTQFYLNSDVSGGHALWDPGTFPGNAKSKQQPRVIDVAATTLDTEVARLGLPAPRVIKIDTEGAEHRVLAGAAGLLRAHAVPYIVAELHEFGLQRLGSSQRALRQFMREYGYDTFALYYDGALPKLIPPETALQSPYFLNVLFSTVEDVARLWQVEHFNPMLAPPPGR